MKNMRLRFLLGVSEKLIFFPRNKIIPLKKNSSLPCEVSFTANSSAYFFDKVRGCMGVPREKMRRKLESTSQNSSQG